MRDETSVDWDAAEAVDPVTRYLQKEQRLETPVARFAEAHATESLRVESYRSLIPLTAPQKGEQYAFEVNLDQCTGCKACVTACHSLNGLDEHEAWRDVGLMQADAPAAYQQTVTSACHHCADPGCLNGCPVDAYDKDPETGIVHHLDDQCIGCQYCILKCPYDVPKYNKRLGIVRKCDMCHSRLAEGEAPACVQACPNEAIRIVKVPTESAISEEDSDPVFKGFPQAATERGYTQPTTRYLSRRSVPEAAQAADARTLRPQHLHGPLVVMLLLTQFSVGLLSSGYLLGSRALLFAAAVSCLAGLMASGAHLGQPLKGWRAFVGWRHSWLSREVIALGAYMPLLAATLLPALSFIAPLAIGVGLVGVFTSVMVYHDTHRRLWQLQWTAIRFYGSSLLAMACGGLAVCAWGDGGSPPFALLGVMAASLFKGAGELGFAKRALSNQEPGAERQSVRLQWGPLRALSLVRWTGLVGGGLLLPLFLLIGNWGSVLQLTLSLALIVTCLTAEIAERMLFFRGVDAPKMPGGVHT